MPRRPTRLLLLASALAAPARADGERAGFVPPSDGPTPDGREVVGGTARPRVEWDEVVDLKGRARGKPALRPHGSQDVDVLARDLANLPIGQGK